MLQTAYHVWEYAVCSACFIGIRGAVRFFQRGLVYIADVPVVIKRVVRLFFWNADASGSNFAEKIHS